MKPDHSIILPSLVSELPLFAELQEKELEKLSSAFERQTFEDGETVIRAGSAPDFLCVLIEGALAVCDDDGERFEVQAPATIGELSALTGELRNLHVVARGSTKMVAAPVAKLEGFLRQNGDIAFTLERTLLRLSARKIGRDRRRLREMRDNIIATQKAMKRMRAALLDSDDNPLNATLFEELDSLIEQNRKIHYLVEPSRLVPTHVRLDDGKTRSVTALSTEWLFFADPPDSLSAGQELICTLLLDGRELPVSGRIERVDPTQVLVYLDELIPAYDAQLNAHLARAQLLDVVI
jgi:CRP-like cAMP-binding protein